METESGKKYPMALEKSVPHIYRLFCLDTDIDSQARISSDYRQPKKESFQKFDTKVTMGMVRH